MAQDWLLYAQAFKDPSSKSKGNLSVLDVVRNLAYVQIDTIHVIERCHHHILYNRLPNYLKQDLYNAQSKEKSLFEYWTHALSYVPVEDFAYYMPKMLQIKKRNTSWFRSIDEVDVARVLKQIKKIGPISIRDIKDDELKQKQHLWDSKKPSKKAMEYAFFSGDLVISERIGMLKKYELTKRHFAWNKMPKAADFNSILDYKLNKALKAQGIVSLDSICHLEKSDFKKQMQMHIEKNIKAKKICEIQVSSLENKKFWVAIDDLDSDRLQQISKTASELKHAILLSPFDPLVLQRNRFASFFDYHHKFEAYLPESKREYGYFTLPVLYNKQICSLIDLKANRTTKSLEIQKWTKLKSKVSHSAKLATEEALDSFHRFQFFS